jgi:hypothetical protein
MVTAKKTKFEDGQTEEITGRRKERLSCLEREGLGQIQSESCVNGVESFRASSFDSSRQNTVGRTIQFSNRDNAPGKILERLKLIESEYLTYIQAERQHHETRIEESEGREVAFKQAVKDLEQEIYTLISPDNASEEE